jgi:diadenosine tetraphosphate (Ap4A) HIT family hydrolase
MSADCIFCQIVARDANASIVYEDALTLAFLDHDPFNAGHTLVIPKRHATHIADLDPVSSAAMFPAAQRVGAALRASGLRCDGVTIHLADGAPAGQDVFHVHLHVIPRWRGDGMRLRPPGRPPHRPPRTELDAIAKALRERLPQQM